MAADTNVHVKLHRLSEELKTMKVRCGRLVKENDALKGLLETSKLRNVELEAELRDMRTVFQQVSMLRVYLLKFCISSSDSFVI